MALAEEEELVFNVEQPLEMASCTSNTATDYWATYRPFIDNLRRRYPPIGAPYWRLTFDIVLRSNSHQIKLRLDRCTFYVVGYRMETPQQWMQFGVESSSRDSSDDLIAGSSSLGMEFGYEDLESESGQRIESIGLGQQHLCSAVDLLATSMCSQDRARSLLIVSLMICEGIRFSYFSDYLAARFHDNLPTPEWMRRILDIYSVTVGVTMVDQGIQPARENPDHIPCPSETIPDEEVLDRVDCDLNSREESSAFKSGDVEIPAANLIGQVQTINTDLVACNKEYYDCHHSGEHNSDIISMPFVDEVSDISTDDDGTSDISTDDDETSDMYPPRLLKPVIRNVILCAFADVFFVRVSSTKGMNPCSFYGTINVNDYGVSQNIYDRGPEQSEFVQPGDLILLTGPARHINVLDGFTISLALMGESFRDFDSFDDYIGKFDKLFYGEFVGEHCSLSVFYIALKTAMHATLTVTFIDEDRNDHARVYGQLSACCDKFGYEIVLFQLKAEEHMDICPGRAIRLLRNVVSVPWNSRLVLRVDLFEYSDTCFDQEIAKCVLEFPLECIAGSTKKFEKIMYRESSKIRVKVVWGYDQL